MNICLLSLPRSGTRYLSHLMEMSPAISKFIDEPFNIEIDNNADMLYTDLCNSKLDEILKINDGLLIKDNLTYYSTQLYVDNDPGILDFIDRYVTHLNTNFVKIKLLRDNIFDQALSNCVLTATRIWVTYHFTPIVQCYIDIEHFKLVVDMYYDKHRMFSTIDADYTIRYDDITGDYDTDWNLLRFLPKPETFVNFGGIPSHPKQHTVTNYQELYDWFQDNKSNYVIDF